LKVSVSDSSVTVGDWIFLFNFFIQDLVKTEEEGKHDNKDVKLREEDLVKRQINELACRINKNFILKNNELNKNNLATKLNAIIKAVYVSDDASLEPSLIAFRDFLVENNDYISSYELSISDIVSMLMFILNGQSAINKKNVFMRVFDDENSGFKILIHKLIMLLESIERLPLYLYDAPYTYNLQVFSKRFKLVLNCGGSVDGDPAATTDHTKNVLNYTGRVLKVEPLANVSHLEKYLSKMVAKHWFDFDRKNLFYLNHIEDVVTKGKCPSFRVFVTFRFRLNYFISVYRRLYCFHVRK
jgi:hypothetical protein